MTAIAAHIPHSHTLAAAQPQVMDGHWLADCAKGQWVTIADMHANSAFGVQDAAVSQRMKELGFLPGAQLKVIGYGLFGCDPLAVQINGTKFALRRAEAQKISVHTR